MVFGKIIGAALGFMAGGLLGAVFGAVVGHFFDRGLGQAMGFDYGGERERVQQAFFTTSFRVMGHLAKADGRICEAEIEQAEALMAQMGLHSAKRQEAIEQFKHGAAETFQLEPEIAGFLAVAGRQPLLRQALLEFLIAMALADGQIHPAEQEILGRVASYLRFDERRFRQLLDMLRAQQGFGSGSYRQAQAESVDALDQAYRALGVQAGAGDAEIKRAYRRLMSQHHPDKLIARGVPEDMLKVATEKSQEIQAAYELIKRSRGKAR